MLRVRLRPPGTHPTPIGEWSVVGSRVELQVCCTKPKATPHPRASALDEESGERPWRGEKRLQNGILGAIDTGG